jgi:hypothetical protein
MIADREREELRAQLVALRQEFDADCDSVPDDDACADLSDHDLQTLARLGTEWGHDVETAALDVIDAAARWGRQLFLQGP